MSELCVGTKEIYIDHPKTRYRSEKYRGPKNEKIAKFYARFFGLLNLAILAIQSKYAAMMLSAFLTVSSALAALTFSAFM
jgi:hypothetical protein